MTTRYTLLLLCFPAVLAWNGLARAQAEPTETKNTTQNIEPLGGPLDTTEFESPITDVFEICALYDETALAMARTQQGFALDEECECERTDQVCDTNWRGAEKHVYVCECTRAYCATTTCSLNVVTATAGAMEECARTSCSCQGSDRVCGDGLLGARYEYACDYP